MTGLGADKDRWENSTLPIAVRRPPWFPTPEDGAFLIEAAAPALRESRAPKLILLGVTPETVQLDWPECSFFAVDSSPAMIEAMWRPNPRLGCESICATWQDLPFESGSLDAIVGDGAFNALPSLDDVPIVLEELARVLRPGGALAVRAFTRPRTGPKPEEIAEAALRGDFPNSSSFRLAFVFALASGGTVRLADVTAAFIDLFPDAEAVAAATRWPLIEIEHQYIDAKSEVSLNFPLVEELTALAEPDFDVLALRRGTYLQAESCPTLQLRRKL